PDSPCTGSSPTSTRFRCPLGCTAVRGRSAVTRTLTGSLTTDPPIATIRSRWPQHYVGYWGKVSTRWTRLAIESRTCKGRRSAGGHDLRRQGRAESAAGDQDLLPASRGLLPIALRRGAAHHRRARRGGSRAGHRRHRSPAAPGGARTLWAHLRRTPDHGRWVAQGHLLRGAHSPGRRGVGPPDRSAGRPRPAGAGIAPAGGLRGHL